MKYQLKKIISLVLCILLLLGSNTPYDTHVHSDDDHDHLETESADDRHGHEDHDSVELLSLLEDTIGFLLSATAVKVYASSYEDGVECEHCGGYRYGDWLCDNGDHCGEGADGSCYEEHHCGYCGA